MTLIDLPTPQFESDITVEQALSKRRSVREFSNESLSLAELAQLLWAAQGITSSKGQRTAPSAGGLYPLELFVAAGNVEGLPTGVYHYRAKRHDLVRIKEGDVRLELSAAALDQTWIRNSAAVLVFTGIYKRTEKKYGKRAPRYIMIETGHAAQNVYLQATTLGIGTTMVGAFHDKKLEKLLSLDEEEKPLALMPLGKLP